MTHNILFLITIIFSLCTAMIAQSDFGTLRGTVSNVAGPAPGTSITLTETASGRTRKAVADNNGFFSFTGLDPGEYDIVPDVTVLDAGNGVRGISVSFGETVTIDLRITASTNFKSLNKITTLGTAMPPISSVAPSFRSQAIIPGRLGKNLSTQEAALGKEELSRIAEASNGSAAVSNNASSNPLGGFSFNGISPDQNSIRIDGADVTPLIVLSAESFQDTSAFFLNMSKRQSLKAFKEFRLDDSNYPAYLGTGSGGKLITDTLKGNSEFRGDIYENFTDEAFGARNYFDRKKPWLSYHLFGGRFSGPLNRRSTSDPKLKTSSVFFFVNYEGIRARSEAILFEAVPSAAARARAVPAVTSLLDAFYTGGAIVIPGATSDPNLDVVRLDTKNKAFRNFLTTRLTYEKSESNNTLNFVYTREASQEDTPDSVNGRRQVKDDRKQTAVLNYTRTEGGWVNELLFSFNATPSRLGARVPSETAAVLSNLSVNVSGTITPIGVPGQPLPLSIAAPGGLLRKNRSFSGRGTRTTPSTFSIIDQIVWTPAERHSLTFGGEFRYLNTYLNVFNGINYRFSNLEDLLQNRPTTVQLAGDLGNPSPFGLSDSSDHRATQHYLIGFLQDKWSIRPNLAVTMGLRYEYYTGVQEERNRNVVFDVSRHLTLPPDTPFFPSSKDNFLPRLALAWAPRFSTPTLAKNPRLISASFGMHAGASSFRDQIKPIENDRIDVTQTGGIFPTSQSILEGLFFNNPTNRQYQPLAFDTGYTNTEKVYKYDVSFKQRLSGNDNSEFYALVSYVGNMGRDLLLRTTANRIISVDTNPNPALPAIVTREFDIPQAGTPLKPFGELDVRTSKGWSRYDSLQVRLNGAFPKANIFMLDAQYTLGRIIGNTNGGSQTVMAGNPFDLEYDRGLSPDDIKHKLTLSTVYLLPIGTNQLYFRNTTGWRKQLLSNWTLAGRMDLQGGKPIDVKIIRPEVVYVDGAGQVFGSPAVGRIARINVPGGGTAFNTQRPDLIPGVNPYLASDRRHLNPAAFAIPAPGTFGDLRRGMLRGPRLALFDLSIKKQFTGKDGIAVFDFRCDITNLFNHTNFDRPPATLPNLLGVGADLLQPGQPFSTTIAPNFGVLNRTFKREQEFGASRQIQFGLVIYFNGGSTKL